MTDLCRVLCDTVLRFRAILVMVPGGHLLVCLPPTAHCPLPTAHCPLPTAHRPLPTAHCLPPSFPFQKIPHHLPSRIEHQLRSLRRRFVVRLRGVGRHAGAGDRQRHGAVAVRLRAHRRRMVRRYQNPVIPLGFQGRVQRTDDVPVDLFQGFDLFLGPPFVRCLVGRLDVNANDVSPRDARRRIAPWPRNRCPGSPWLPAPRSSASRPAPPARATGPRP